MLVSELPETSAGMQLGKTSSCWRDLSEVIFPLFWGYVLWGEDMIFGVVVAILIPWDNPPEDDNPMCWGSQSKRMGGAWDLEDITELLDQFLNSVSSDLWLERIMCMSLLFKSL